ncbi:MAG TPA: MFS transporter, partial [Chitinophagaceae bacterium]|nr:MFS transporter [Chitinophagaceae bacterium]
MSKDALQSLRYPEFRNYILARFFFILVLNMQATLILWKVYELTRDPLSIGTLGIVEFVPACIMAFYSGHVIDKSDKRNLLLKSVGGNFMLTALLCFFTSAYAVAHFTHTWLLLSIYFVVFGTGILRSFSGPTSFALLSHLVPRNLLSNATLWHSGSWQVGAVTGPALAGLLYGSIGITNTFYLMLILMSIALAGLVFIKPKPFIGERRQEAFLESLIQGFRFVWHSKEVLGALSLDLFAVLFGGATALLPVFADKILHVGPEGLGMLRSAPALGSVVILMMLTFKPLKRKQGTIMLLCVAGFGMCMIAFGLSTVFWLSMLALFISGILDGVSVIVRSTILQLKTPDEMRGRVAALNSIFIMSSNELGAAESGVAAKLLGT